MRSSILFLIACILPFCGFSEIETVEGVVWRYYISNDQAIVGGYETTAVAKDNSGDIRIPVKLGGKPVTSIHSSAFSGCSLLTNVEIHEGVSSIGQHAFSGCNALSQIAIPSTIVNILSGTFGGCSGLRKVEIKNPKASICTTDGISGSQILRPAFGGCSSIVEATVPNTSMIRYIFPDSYNIITNITLTEGTTEIRSETFLDCYALECVVMPKTVGEILGKAFYNCKALKSFIIPDSVTLLGSSAFSNCSSLTNVVMSKNLGRIESAAFHYCSSLSSVIIPNSVTNIGNYAFSSCTSLSNVEIPDSITNIRQHSFSYCTILENVEIPDSVKGIEQYAFYGCSSLSSVVIPNSVVNIGDGAFASCGLRSIKMENEAMGIHHRSFDGCNSLVDIDGLPQYVCDRSITNAFKSSYQAITNIVVASGVTRIAADCFKDCYSLKRIVIPASVLVIYDHAFSNCSELEEIVFLGDAPDVGSDILLGTPRSLKITVKEGSVGWKGGVSTELPEVWPVGDATAREIKYSRSNDSPEGGGSSGGEIAVVDTRYDLADDVADRAIANVEIDGDAAIDSFVLKDGKVYDSVVRIVNTSALAAKISLPGGFIYEKFKGTRPLEIPATSTNLLTITRTKGDTFLLSREELVLEVQE